MNGHEARQRRPASNQALARDVNGQLVESNHQENVPAQLAAVRRRASQMRTEAADMQRVGRELLAATLAQRARIKPRRDRDIQPLTGSAT
jgi:hypothetical protein